MKSMALPAKSNAVLNKEKSKGKGMNIEADWRLTLETTHFALRHWYPQLVSYTSGKQVRILIWQIESVALHLGIPSLAVDEPASRLQ
jgi:hypothetical protein